MNRKNFISEIDFLKGQPKFQHPGNIELPSSSYSLHGYSGQLGARSTTVEKAI